MNHNSFCLKDIYQRKYYPCQKEFALLSQNIILHSTKDNCNTVFNIHYMNVHEKKKKSKETLLLKKTRLFKKEHIFDSITLSLDFMNSIDEILKCFDISKIFISKVLITQYLKIKYSQMSQNLIMQVIMGRICLICLYGLRRVDVTQYLLGLLLILKKELCNVIFLRILRM